MLGDRGLKIEKIQNQTLNNILGSHTQMQSKRKNLPQVIELRQSSQLLREYICKISFEL